MESGAECRTGLARIPLRCIQAYLLRSEWDSLKIAQRAAANYMAKILAIFLLFSCVAVQAAPWAAPTRCDQPLPQRLYESAMAAPGAAGSDGKLYGMQRWRKATGNSYYGLRFPGLLSCAYTVSAIFQGACQPIGELASVAQVEARLAKWQKISGARELKRGDVVFWRPAPGKIFGFNCPGHWHVGISLGGELTMDNDWATGYPQVGRLTRACTLFDHARRPPG